MGFLASSGKRQRVLRSLDRHGDMEADRIASIERLPGKVVESILEQSRGRGLVEKRGGEFGLTDEGSALLARLTEFER